MTARRFLLCSLFVMSVRTAVSAEVEAKHRSPLKGDEDPHISVTQSSGLDLHHVHTDMGSPKGSRPAKTDEDSKARNDFWSMGDGQGGHVDVKRDIPESKDVSTLKGMDDMLEGTVYDTEDIEEVNDVDETYSEDESTTSIENPEDMKLLKNTNIVPVFLPVSSKREGPYWATRGKKGIRDYIPFYWGSNQNMWGKTVFSRSSLPLLEANDDLQNDGSSSGSSFTKSSGWESNQNFWGKRDNGPFWIARGKKGRDEEGFWPKSDWSDRSWGPNPWYFGKRNRPMQSPRYTQVDSANKGRRDANGPFWLSRGKRSAVTDELSPWAVEELKYSDNFWTPRGKKEFEDEGLRPFWVARGKKKDKNVDSASSNEEFVNPFWVARGKKEQNPFWVARGKKNDDSMLIEDTKEYKPFWIARGKKFSDMNPFWISRGKKEEIADNPFWVARGKKEPENNPFWVGRGNKETEDNEFWAVRGKKDGVQNPYWIARGKKQENPFWVSRGKKSDTGDAFWVARGKKLKALQKDSVEDNGPFWVVRGRRGYDSRLPQEMPDQLTQFLMMALANKYQGQTPQYKGLRGKKNLSPNSQRSTGGTSTKETFMALRG